MPQWSIMNCQHCSEPICAGERIDIYLDGRALHHECAARRVLGSLAHVEGRCSCYVEGADEIDPPEMTPRQAAKAALDAYLARHRSQLQ